MKMIKTLATLTLAASAFAALASAANAYPAKADVALNVRTGPGTEFSVLDQLTLNERVNVVECTTSGWCYVDQDGPDGWVAERYLTDLTPPPAPPPTPTPTPTPAPSGGCRFEVTVGTDGPHFNLVCPGAPTPPPTPTPTPTPSPAPNTACFYTGNNYTGSEFCNGIGDLPTLGAAYNDAISSVKLNGDVVVKLCDNAFFGGTCLDIDSNRPNLGAASNRASSIKVSPTPPPGPVVPAVRSQGNIALQQTFQANLDNGNVGAGGADIWFEAVNPIQKYLTPVNGAKLSLGDGSLRGYLACQGETYSDTRISLGLIDPGTALCVKTNNGRTSVIRVDSYAGTTMNLSYRTWE
ncbi:MAG: SH3 domain-containing protein [Hyphomicrobiaceae bacterium]|nr:SH3 domain-containing protein [Hyphomicrobiaceae bacterium]MCC0023252.1 SH3 domain-containing protein [Hyphomicrobiaceae bacterium]